MRHETSGSGLLGLCLAGICLLAIGWSLHSGPARGNSLFVSGHSASMTAQSAVSD